MENKPGQQTPLLDGPISRRSLLKGLGGGALALGAGGLLEACSSKVKGSGTSSADKIVIGFVTPQTGPARRLRLGRQLRRRPDPCHRRLHEGLQGRRARPTAWTSW